MHKTNGAGAMTGKRFLGIAVAGGAAAFVLASGGTAMASPFHGRGPAHTINAGTGWNRVTNIPASGPVGAGNGKTGHQPGSTSAPGQGAGGTPVGGTGWNRVTNVPAPTPAPAGGGHFTGGQGGVAPGAGGNFTGAPKPVLHTGGFGNVSG